MVDAAASAEPRFCVCKNPSTRVISTGQLAGNSKCRVDENVVGEMKNVTAYVEKNVVRFDRAGCFRRIKESEL